MGRARVTGKWKLTQRQEEIEESKSAPNGSNARDEHIEPNNDKMGRTRAAKKKKLAQIQKEIEESESAPKCYNARDEHIKSDNNVRHEDNPRESKYIAIQTAVNFENNGARTEGSSQAAEDNAMQTEVNADAVMDKLEKMGRAWVTGKRKLTQGQNEIEESKSAPNGSNARDEHIEPNNDKVGRTRAAKKKKLAPIQKEIEESESAPKCYNARDEHIKSDKNVRHEGNPQASKNTAIQTSVNFDNNGARAEGKCSLNSQATEDNAMQTEVNVDAVMDMKIGKARDMKKKKFTRKQTKIEGSKSTLKVSNAMAKLSESDNDVGNEDDPHASKNSASLTILQKMGRTSDMKKKLSRKHKEIEEPKFAPKGSKSRDEHIELDEDVPNEGNPQTSKNNAIQMIICFENNKARTKDNPQAFEDDIMQTEEKYKAVMDKKKGKGRGRAKKKKKTQSTPKGSNVRNEHIGLSKDVRNEDNLHAFKYNAAQTEVNSENNNAQVQYDPQSFVDNAVQTEGSFEPVMEIGELIQNEDKNRIEKKRTRGPTIVERLYFDLASRIKVEFNAEGVPIGAGSVKLSSYLGPLVRKHVPVTLNDWRRVGDELKAVMWESIQAKFILDKEWQKKVIFQQMGCIWRGSKCILVRKIIKAKTEEERSKLKPDNVESMEWNKFVESKTSLDFKTRSDKYKAMRSNQILHTCGRRGMARLAEDLKENSGDPSSISRAQVWIRSRTRKNGEPVSLTVADTIEKIKQIENESESNSAIDVKENALSQLLGQDKWGNTTVRCKALTNVTSSHAKDKQIAQFQSRISELEGMVHMVMKNQGKEILREESIAQMSKCGKISEKCDLLDWGETDEIVAEGRVVSSDPNELVHKVPLGPNAMKILVLISKKSDAFLWRPTPSLTYIGDAEDRIVAWPASRVVIRTGKTSSTDNKCKLYDWSGSEELVAEGRLCSNDPKQLVNDIPLGPSAMAIWVDNPKKQDAFLWRPTPGMTFVGEAVGKKVAWPKSNVAIENLNVVASPSSPTNAEKQNAFLGKPTSGIINFGEAVSRKESLRKSNVLSEKFNSVASPTPTMNAAVSPMTTNMMAKNKCKLIDLSGRGEIVAEGHVLSTNPKALVHFIPLGRNAVKVMVDFVKVPNAVLWRPSSELEYMEDAIGTTIAWPTTNVIMESTSDN